MFLISWAVKRQWRKMFFILTGCCTSCAVRVKSGQIRQPEALGISAELKSKVGRVYCLHWGFLHMILWWHDIFTMNRFLQLCWNLILSFRSYSLLWFLLHFGWVGHFLVQFVFKLCVKKFSFLHCLEKSS